MISINRRHIGDLYGWANTEWMEDDIMSKKTRELSRTPYGRLPVSNTNGCDAWQRASCLEQRIANEPESMMVEDRPDIIRCPVCHHVVELKK